MCVCISIDNKDKTSDRIRLFISFFFTHINHNRKPNVMRATHITSRGILTAKSSRNKEYRCMQ
uniref:Uncharacterized protein n=1 Tax=Octopus bimaculoides TaxID=37653 RepID=A0A0L8HAB2_OCTBM